MARTPRTDAEAAHETEPPATPATPETPARPLPPAHRFPPESSAALGEAKDFAFHFDWWGRKTEILRFASGPEAPEEVADLVARARLLDELSIKSIEHEAAKETLRRTFDPTDRLALKEQTRRMLQVLNAVRARIDAPRRGINCNGVTTVQQAADDVNRQLMHALNTAGFFKGIRLTPVVG